MTKYIVKFYEAGEGFMMGTGVNASNKDEALDKALGFKGDEFESYNKMVVDAVNNGRNISARVVPKKHYHEFGPLEMKKTVKQEEAVNLENRGSITDLM